MKVFVAGATGAMGRPLVRLLVARGHQVIGLTRTSSKRRLLASLGAETVVGDALDPERLIAAVRETSPTHIVHLLTAIPPEAPLRARDLDQTNRLRTEGTAHLLSAARESGVRRLVAESFLGIYGAPEPGAPLTEDQLSPESSIPNPLAGIVGALRQMESQLADENRAGGVRTVALRFGIIYGRGVPSTEAMLGRLRAGRLFLPKTTGSLSYIQIDDAATAMLAALEHPAPADVYNIVDNRPMTYFEFATAAAQALGTRPPHSIPQWVLRLVAPYLAAAASVDLPLSNARALSELAWQPSCSSAQDGFRRMAVPLREAA